jgi:glutaminyl-tRNA synthetase
LKDAKIGRDVADAKTGKVFQFMRQGYFCLDNDSEKDRIVINRTVALKDSFSKTK